MTIPSPPSYFRTRILLSNPRARKGWRRTKNCEIKKNREYYPPVFRTYIFPLPVLFDLLFNEKDEKSSFFPFSRSKGFDREGDRTENNCIS